jgi:soluble lytic murein transglycosylase-like protein
MYAIRALCRASCLLLLAACLRPAAAAAQMYYWQDERGDLHFTDQPRHAGFKRYELPPMRPQAARYDPSWLGRSWAWDADIMRAGRKLEVSPALVKAVIHAESAFDPDARSRRGAGGLMQLMPVTAREMGVHDRFDPAQNILGGTRYLKDLMLRFGDVELAVAAYNAGPEAVRRHGGVPPYRETRTYVRNVIGLYQQYRRDFTR